MKGRGNCWDTEPHYSCELLTGFVFNSCVSDLALAYIESKQTSYFAHW